MNPIMLDCSLMIARDDVAERVRYYLEQCEAETVTDFPVTVSIESLQDFYPQIDKCKAEKLYRESQGFEFKAFIFRSKSPYLLGIGIRDTIHYENKVYNQIHVSTDQRKFFKEYTTVLKYAPGGS